MLFNISEYKTWDTFHENIRYHPDCFSNAVKNLDISEYKTCDTFHENIRYHPTSKPIWNTEKTQVS